MARLQDFYRVVEVSDGDFLAGEIFRHKLGHELPDRGRHLIGCYRAEAFRFVPLGYLQIGRHDTVALVGGGCTDGRAFAHVDAGHSAAIRDAGGVLFTLLRYAFTQMADDFEAFFGYCGDARAEEVDLQAGFEYTRHKYLLAHFHRPLGDERKRALTEAVYELGPF
ncbi:hypothetical protein [Wenzhouxiangella sp. EGI_FJ10305]|uniref:hypothetical protein n=1 Tax=Wenzhouxiangella sp. EGI_FJ10305 TaxID=3243768 RepID=UPI0035DBFDF5